MKILTALQDPKTNEILKEKTKHNIIETDIQYQEGILETLEKNNKIDLIIISQLLPGNIGFKDLINKIKIINNNIEIIAICLLYTSPSPRDLGGSRMPSSA